MKILFLNKNECTALMKLLSNSIRNNNCEYSLTTILEKLNSGQYEKIFRELKD